MTQQVEAGSVSMEEDTIKENIFSVTLSDLPYIQ